MIIYIFFYFLWKNIIECYFTYLIIKKKLFSQNKKLLNNSIDEDPIREAKNINVETFIIFSFNQDRY